MHLAFGGQQFRTEHDDDANPVTPVDVASPWKNFKVQMDL